MDSTHDFKKRMQLHKRQRVTETAETTTTAARGRARTSATELAAVDTTATSASSYHQRPSFLTATTRTTALTTAVAPVASSSSSVTTIPTTEEDTTTSTSSSTTRAKAGTTTSASPVSNVATGATQSNGFNSATATPIGASPKSNSSGSSSHGGAVAGAIIAVIAVLAIGVGFFIWRKRRNNRLARDGLIGGGNGFSGGAGGYKKQDEDGRQDTWDGNNNNGSSNGMTRDDSSLFGGREKTFSQESFTAGNVAGGGAGGYGATTTWNNNGQQQQQQPQPQGFYNAGGGPQESSWNENNNVYPPMNQAIPPSTSNLLSHQPAMSNNNLPASLAAGAGAGAAGFGAARLLAAQSTSPPGSISHFDSSAHQSIEQRELRQELDNRRQSFMNKTAQPPVAVAAGAGESPFGESEGQGEIRIVKGTFDPSLDDELVLYPGDKVQVLMKYDDGWALGLNLSSGVPPSKGVFPFDCLGEQVSAPQPSEIRSHDAPVPSAQRSLSPINPANVPLPPPTPTLLSPINEDEQPPQASTTREGPPQLAPFERSDSPLSPDFPPSSLTIPSSNNASPTKATKLKRHSSLIASRDADLFVALGEVLDKEKH
ncbi:hypothetical protein JCM3765_000731 [Sporobolomyces pararoseus]